MKKILWVSRHQMTEGQLDDLKRIYGEFELVKFDQTVSNVKEIIETGNKILNPATGKKELEYKFIHVSWEQVLKIEIITKKLQFRKRTIFD